MTNKTFKLLYDRIEETDIERKVLCYKKETMSRVANIVREKNPMLDEESVKYISYRETIAEVLKYDLYWLIRWITPERESHRVQEVHKVICDFMSIGEKALPPEYKWGCKFAFRPVYLDHINNMGKHVKVDVTPMLIQISRGLGKSVMFNVMKAIQRYIQDPFSKGYLVHGDVDRAADNLTQVRRFIMSPYLTTVYPQMFATEESTYLTRGGRITSKKLNIATILDLDEFKVGNDVRREATWSIGSPKTSSTGQHYDYEHDDDLVTDETSKSPSATEQIRKYYLNNFPLANTAGIYPRLLVGTEWWENSLYDILKKKEEVSYFYLPAYWSDPKGKVYFSSPIYDNEKKLNAMKKQYAEWYEPHILLIPKKFDTELKLVTDYDFVFKYSDERGREEVNEIDFTKNELRNKGFVVTSKDPSYSKLNKTWTSDCSKDTTITGVVLDEKLYIIQESQLLGGDPTEIYVPLKYHVEENKSDMIIIDAQGTQIHVAQTMFDRINEDFSWEPYCRPHKRSEATSKSKADRAMLTLAELFNTEKIMVHHSCKRLIDEIMRTTTGYDFLDTLIQICNVGLKTLSYIEKKSNDSGLGILIHSKKKAEYVNRITGY